MSKVCSDCQFSIQDFPDLFCTVRKLSTKDGLFVNCLHYLPKTLFDRITRSPVVLAPRLVFCAEYKTIKPMYLEGKGGIIVGEVWKSTVIDGASFKTKAEAIAATVAKLNEVCDE